MLKCEQSQAAAEGVRASAKAHRREPPESVNAASWHSVDTSKSAPSLLLHPTQWSRRE